MKCMICSEKMYPYFSKIFKKYGLHKVNYWKCENCGFVMSKTHKDLSDYQWKRLNEKYHAAYHGTNIASDDSRWIARIKEQALVIADLTKLGLIPEYRPWLDYGCGDGKLSDILKNEFGLNLLKYDRYVAEKLYLSEDQFKSNIFDFIITTSVFEHILKRESLEEIVSNLSNSGVMGLHVFVSEQIPRDPAWFYLLPVHCSFYTNKSMQILFNEWNFVASLYHVSSRLWIWFKNDAAHIEKLIHLENSKPEREKLYYHFKRGFMDYWK